MHVLASLRLVRRAGDLAAMVHALRDLERAHAIEHITVDAVPEPDLESAITERWQVARVSLVG